MSKSELFKELKGLIRMNADTICDMEEGKISFGKMCEIIAKDIEKHLEEKYNKKREILYGISYCLDVYGDFTIEKDSELGQAIRRITLE